MPHPVADRLLGRRRLTAALLPPALRGGPVVIARAAAEASGVGDATADALTRIRREMLFWPAVRRTAARPRVLALDRAGLAEARRCVDDADIAATRDLSAVDPDRLERVFGAPGLETLWARIGGLAAPSDAGGPDPAAALAGARGRLPVDPGADLPLAEALEAQALASRAPPWARAGPRAGSGRT
jgi:hypothetical protein